MKKDIKELCDDAKKMERKMKSLCSNLEESKRENDDLREKNRELPAVTPSRKSSSIGDDPLLRDIEKMQAIHFSREKNDEREEKKETRKEDRRNKQKDSRSKIGMGLMGSSGMFNHNAKDILDQVVGSLLCLQLSLPL